ncbi:hypothetical protein BDN67DRAFT_980186 [Paxillus ammoniavirescens]|nr:hypothetical protein BDN67DRAFT_980186 [Paxillus ammoniavirescens]
MPRSHTGSFGMGSAAGEHPAQTLEELRQALRDNAGGQAPAQPSFPMLAAIPPEVATGTRSRSRGLVSARKLTGEREDKVWTTTKRKGTNREKGRKSLREVPYTYLISFMLPPHLPPTLARLYGTLGYTLKGVVHKPGTFTSKISCHVLLLVVTAPSIEAGGGGGVGDPGPIIVERQWEGRLAYIVGLSGRAQRQPMA